MKRWKNRARRWLLLLVLAVLAAGTALPAAADMGPKPSVEVVFQGLEGQRFYATLLGNVTQYGPWSADEEYLDWRGDPEAWKAFTEYPKPEGWYFLGNYADCTETGRFVWSYYPPETFYVLVWLPEEDRCLRSVQPVSRYAFDSRFTVTATEEGLTVRSSYDYAGEVPGFLVRVALTILIETAAGWLLFGLRRPGEPGYPAGAQPAAEPLRLFCRAYAGRAGLYSAGAGGVRGGRRRLRPAPALAR